MLEDLLEMIEYPPPFKVRLASYQFEKEVNFWLATIKPQAGQPQLTWQQFKDLVDENTIPMI